MRAISPGRSAGDFPARGIALRIAGATCFAIMAAAIKLAAERGVGLAEQLFYRNLFALPVILTALLVGPGLMSVRTAHWRSHVLRSLAGLVALSMGFLVLSVLPLAEATGIGFTAPIFATVLSAVFMAERVGPHRWAAVALGMLGALVMIRPGGHGLSLQGTAIGLCGALAVAFVQILLRQIGMKEPATTTVFWFNLLCLAITALPMPVVAAPHDMTTMAVLAVVGFAGGGSQLLMTSSLRFAPVSALAPFDYVQLIWAILAGWTLWSTLPDGAALLGSAMIAASGLLILWREQRVLRAAPG
jgi:drug/metabolite transporter (DMT)-like permease